MQKLINEIEMGVYGSMMLAFWVSEGRLPQSRNDFVEWGGKGTNYDAMVNQVKWGNYGRLLTEFFQEENRLPLDEADFDMWAE